MSKVRTEPPPTICNNGPHQKKSQGGVKLRRDVIEHILSGLLRACEKPAECVQLCGTDRRQILRRSSMSIIRPDNPVSDSRFMILDVGADTASAQDRQPERRP
jgi:hypothetical protein